ncbi:hypothetical protein PI126_g4959 [Phytophthora idaei]|nr:hypothetical protein PI126_g4959 [Phytophthora idaei]
MLCYRLSYPGKLFRVRKKFGRSDSSCSRIVTELYCFLVKEWSDMLPFNDRVYTACHNMAFVPRMDCAYRILDLLKDDFMILQCCV